MALSKIGMMVQSKPNPHDGMTDEVFTEYARKLMVAMHKILTEAAEANDCLDCAGYRMLHAVALNICISRIDLEGKSDDDILIATMSIMGDVAGIVAATIVDNKEQILATEKNAVQ